VKAVQPLPEDAQRVREAMTAAVLPSFRDSCNRVWGKCGAVWNRTVGRARGYQSSSGGRRRSLVGARPRHPDAFGPAPRTSPVKSSCGETGCGIKPAIPSGSVFSSSPSAR
jgi:hypothetical protein